MYLEEKGNENLSIREKLYIDLLRKNNISAFPIGQSISLLGMDKIEDNVTRKVKYKMYYYFFPLKNIFLM